MAFRRTEIAKSIELPTFIDVIFLLLIFFLLTYSPVPPQKGQSTLQLTLPIAKGLEKVQLSERLQTMMVEVFPLKAKDLTQGYRVNVLLPFEDYSVVEVRPRVITISKAREYAQRYGRMAILPANYAAIPDKDFLELDAIKMLDRELERYVEYRFKTPKPTNRIEIRADATIKFRLIGHILEKCSSFGDLVPMVVFRTMYGGEQ